ncbi:AAA family ATPase [Dactylosporangium sp. CA-052675]|uniref:AAA family ATPase n=1 Tax=Dactylosporangium sp. CA-052675 TaxID=3239927 RepID=UPI003D8DFF42
MTTTSIPVCWSRAEIQNAAQIDAGSLAFDDPVADALFQAVHQAVPLARHAADRSLAPVTESDVLDDICQPIHSNEPLIRFITGRTGTGKSHLVRWLRTSVPDNENWHLIYIEKRNTSLRRIIEQILTGIDTAGARTLRSSLAQAATRTATLPAAMLALIHQLIEHVRFDDAPVVADLDGPDLADARDFVARLLADHTFQQQISRTGGPMERIARLAIQGLDSGDDVDVNPADLRFRAQDLDIDIHAFGDVGQEVFAKVRQVVANADRRTEVSAIIDHYLPAAIGAVVTGGGTDLLTVFEGVRAELAGRGKELFLFIEDLVLLHGIDGQLAQALTVPARPDLCRIRAVIAVTTGYLGDRYSTFADRGSHYTMDVDRKKIDPDDLRTFVGKYLNAGRVGRAELTRAARAGEQKTPNKCPDCEFVDQCHPTFGATREGHGLFPFNRPAVDRLIALASPDGFDPRRILRQVVRAPLEVAEAELDTPGAFPSARFAELLAPKRDNIPLEARDEIMKLSANGEAELSLRAFYAARPPTVDEELEDIAAVFGVRLTELSGVHAAPDEIVERREPAAASSVDAWARGEQLPSTDTVKIRRWIMNALTARLMNHAHGLHVSPRQRAVEVAGIEIGWRHIVIQNAAGGGEPAADLTIEFKQRDSDAVLLKGVLAAGGGDLLGPNSGRWWFDLQARLDDWENQIVQRASQTNPDEIVTALTVLGVLSSIDDRPRDTPAQALAVLIKPSRPDDLPPAIRTFLNATEKQRDDALGVVRARLTRRKAGGAPTIIDAAAVLSDLVTAARNRAIPATGPGVDTLEWRAVANHQREAARSAWTSIAGLLGAIAAVIAPTENMLETVEVMDRFVVRAAGDGVLGSPDARQQYDRLRAFITGSSVATHRKLTKIQMATLSPADLWLLNHDPSQGLRAMAEFWALCDRLLKAAEIRASSATETREGGGRTRLVGALRALADRLDEKSER